VAAGEVHAQAAPPLTAFVNDAATNATEMQRQAGVAVQRTCSALALEGGLQLTSVKGDLFRRCNEMVETARVFQGSPGGTTRSLGYTDRNQLLATIQQVSGEEIAAQGALSTQASAGQFANIGGRLSALRFGGASAAARGRVAQLEGVPQQLLASATSSGPSRAYGRGASADGDGSSAVERPVGWFLESSYGFGDHDQTDTEDAFDFDSVSATTGADYNFGAGVVGFAVGYDRYTADFDTAQLVTGGETEVEGVSGSLFAGFFGSGWTLNGIATYGQLESEVTRRTVYESLRTCNPSCGAARTLRGNPDGDYLALGATLGYELTAGGWDISPTLSASYRDVTIDGYDEVDTFPDGGLALRYEEQSIESMRSILGIAMSRPISRSFGVLTPSLRAEWHHEFEDEARTVRAKYVAEDSMINGSAAQDFGCTISCFSMLSDAPDADYGVASAGLTLTFPRRVQLYFVYEALLGASNISGNSIAAGLRGQF
jgi:uncharacterized protein YhjY with autotransporter beta-barrel domain